MDLINYEAVLGVMEAGTEGEEGDFLLGQCLQLTAHLQIDPSFRERTIILCNTLLVSHPHFSHHLMAIALKLPENDVFALIESSSIELALGNTIILTNRIYDCIFVSLY